MLVFCGDVAADVTGTNTSECAQRQLSLLLVLKHTWSLSQVLKRSTSECVHVLTEETSRNTNTGKKKKKKRHWQLMIDTRKDTITPKTQNGQTLPEKRGKKKTETRES